MAGSAQAATFTVTNSNDSGAGSLRDALGSAGSSDTITFDPSVTSPITLTSGSLPITQPDLTIQGPGAGTLTIDANHLFQVFNITSAESTGTGVTISGLTLTNGNSGGGNGGAISWNPNNQISNASPLKLIGDVISASVASGNSFGGGVYANGPLSISGSTIEDNSAGSGGGVSVNGSASNPGQSPGSLTLSDSTVSGNAATGGPGGGILIQTKYFGFAGNAHSTISNSHVVNNQSNGSSAYGGGVAEEGGSLTVQGSTVTGNTVTAGANARPSSGSGGGIFSAAKYGTTVSGSTISGNTASHGGGGVMIDTFVPPQYQSQFPTQKYSPATIDTTTVAGNQAPDGAGIEVAGLNPGSPMLIDRSTISGNQGGAGSFGGGIALDQLIGAPFRVRNSTISGNSADHGGGVSLGNGNGYEQFPSHNGQVGGSVRLAGTTISGNTATLQGGGVYLAPYAAGATPSSSPNPPSPDSKTQAGTVALTSTIVSGNKAEDLARGAGATTGGFTGTFSLVQTPGAAPLTGTSLILGQDPQLGPLANNGGPTQTMLPSGTSPVIDQGHSAGEAVDQIGNPRTVDTAVPNPSGGDGTDIGAVELPASSVVVPSTDPGFRVGIRTTLTLPGNPLGTGTPLLVGDQTPVTCTVRVGTLRTCQIELRSGTRVIASGSASDRNPTNTITAVVEANADGRRLLASHPLGLNLPATALTDAPGAQPIDGMVRFLPDPRITLPIVGRSATLTRGLLAQLAQAATLLGQTRSVTCLAYTDHAPTVYVIRGTGHHRHRVALPNTDTALTQKQATAACTALRNDGLKATTRAFGAGHAREVASDRSAAGRAANRRLVITFSF
jgi:hypothetical protein